MQKHRLSEVCDTRVLIHLHQSLKLRSGGTTATEGSSFLKTVNMARASYILIHPHTIYLPCHFQALGLGLAFERYSANPCDSFMSPEFNQYD